MREPSGQEKHTSASPEDLEGDGFILEAGHD